MPSLLEEIMQKGDVRVLTDPDEIAKAIVERAKHAASGISYRQGDDGIIVQQETPTGLVCDKASTAPKLPDADETRALVEALGMPWRDDYAGRIEHFWTSDERVDLAGDIVRQNWDFQMYERLSRVLHGHDWGGVPIGRSILWEVRDRTDKASGYKGPSLYQVFLFATEDVSPDGDQKFRLIKARFMTETSVGFYPLKIIHVEDEDDRKKLGLGRWGVIFDHNMLVETSTCTVACNDGAQVAAALTTGKEKGLVVAEDFEGVRRIVASDKPELDRTICDVFKSLFGVKQAPTVEDCQKQIDELRRMQAETSDTVLGFLKNLRDGVAGLYPAQDVTREEPQEEENDDEDPLFDSELDESEEDDEYQDDEDDFIEDDEEDDVEDDEEMSEEFEEDDSEPDDAGDGDSKDAEPDGDDEVYEFIFGDK